MLTGHLLFVGYSMSDESIVRLARDVQRAREAFAADSISDEGSGVSSAARVPADRVRNMLAELGRGG